MVFAIYLQRTRQMRAIRNDDR